MVGQLEFEGPLYPFHHLAGVPQRSTSAFSFTYRTSPHPLYSMMDNSYGIAQFADDTGFWFSSTPTRHFVRNLTQILNDLLAYCNKWRIQLNAAKTTLLLLIKCFKHTLTVKVPGRSLYPWLVPTKTCTSRITLDSTLNFQMHLPSPISFRTVNNRNKVCSSRLSTTLYTAALTFGHPLFNSKPETHCFPQAD